MIFSLDFRSLVLCYFLCFSWTLCKPLESNSEEKFNEGLRKFDRRTYEGFLLLAMAAASSGKSFFKTPQNLNEDCVRTARVIMQLFETPSTWVSATLILYEGVEEVYKHKMSSTFDQQVTMFCKEVNQRVKKSDITFSNFEAMKKAVEVPRPAKTYILEVPSDQNVKEWGMNASMPYDDTELIKFHTTLQIQTFINMKSVDDDQKEVYSTAKAINELSMSPNSVLKTETDIVFEKTLKDFIKNFLSEGKKKVSEVNIKDHINSFLKKLDQNFLGDVLLKDDYSQKKKEAASLVTKSLY